MEIIAVADWALLAIGSMIGAGVTVGQAALLRRWQRKDAARARVEGRSEEAALKLLEVFEGLHRSIQDQLMTPNQITTQITVPEDTIKSIEQQAHYFADKGVRDRLRKIARMLHMLPTVAKHAEGSQVGLALSATSWAMDGLGALLRDEPVPVNQQLESYLEALARYDALSHEEIRRVEAELAESLQKVWQKYEEGDSVS
jgi:ABC-type transporter Mla subunit MlaD